MYILGEGLRRTGLNSFGLSGQKNLTSIESKKSREEK
jgi:hypothetical protein